MIVDSNSKQTLAFHVTNEAKEKGVKNPVVCLIKNVVWKATEECKVYDEIIENLMEKISEIRKHTFESEEVKGFKKLYSNIGSKVVPAGEKFFLNCEKNNFFKRYGNLVDAYNILALETVSPFGMHDASEIVNNESPVLLFKRASGGEQIIPAFKNKGEKIPKGDFTYGTVSNDKFNSYAWLGKKDVDSKDYQIKGEKTKHLLFTAIGNEYTSQERNIELCNKVFELIKKSCPEATLEICLPKFID